MKKFGKIVLSVIASAAIILSCGCVPLDEYSSVPSNDSIITSTSTENGEKPTGGDTSSGSTSSDNTSSDASNSDTSSSSSSSSQNTSEPDNKPSTGDGIVSTHGQLSVKGTDIVDKNGNPYQLRGMSTHGLTWFPDFVNENSFKTLRDDWNTNVVRMAMYVDEWGNGMCYMGNKQGSRDMLEKGVNLCIELDMYAIIDWHVLNPGDPMKYINEAAEFFSAVSKKYADFPNIIYEICNEPNNGADWDSNIKPYAEKIIPIIRENDPDAIIIVGTPTWSQEVDKALANPLKFDNVMYAVHFYADTHRDDLRNRVKTCVNGGLPIFVSEFGMCDASGGGGNNFVEAEKWLSMLDELNISYCNWALADKQETCCVINPGAGANGNWSEGQLTESGKWIRNWFRKHSKN
ncbi:MAG: glycoside hydrolase family 5 protein [Oscillospiraceae bacterium]